MSLKEAIEILNKHRHRGVSWILDKMNNEAQGLVYGHPETSNDYYLSEFESIAIAEKYLKIL